MKGLIASGKSTKSKEIIESSGNTVRINKDLIRTMLHFDKFTHNNEDLTRKTSLKLTDMFLEMDVNVIIDDTNLKQKTVDSYIQIAGRHKAKIEYITMDTPIVDCIYRDSLRANPLGKDVIMNMAIENGLQTFDKKSVILCDLDGTLCDIEHRLHFVKGETKDWKSFFNGIPEDKPRQDVVDRVISEYNKGKEIIFVSARPDTYKKETMDWLTKHNLSFCITLIMRGGTDRRPDTEVKKDILNRYFKDKSVIDYVIDDRPSVIRMWKEEGLDVVDVGSGVEF